MTTGYNPDSRVNLGPNIPSRPRRLASSRLCYNVQHVRQTSRHLILVHRLVGCLCHRPRARSPLRQDQPAPSDQPVWCCASGGRACRSFVGANAPARRGLRPSSTRSIPNPHTRVATSPWLQRAPFSFCLCLTRPDSRQHDCVGWQAGHTHSLSPTRSPALSGKGLVGRGVRNVEGIAPHLVRCLHPRGTATLNELFTHPSL